MLARTPGIVPRNMPSWYRSQSDQSIAFHQESSPTENGTDCRISLWNFPHKYPQYSLKSKTGYCEKQGVLVVYPDSLTRYLR